MGTVLAIQCVGGEMAGRRSVRFPPKETKMVAIPMSRIAIKSPKMLVVAVLIAILNFQTVASFNLQNKKDKDTFCMLKIAGIINI